mgnify:CR=1 FL=1
MSRWPIAGSASVEGGPDVGPAVVDLGFQGDGSFACGVLLGCDQRVLEVRRHVLPLDEGAGRERLERRLVAGPPEVLEGVVDVEEEVGELVAYLCSPAASYINGQAINIDGGLVTEH